MGMCRRARVQPGESSDQTGMEMEGAGKGRGGRPCAAPGGVRPLGVLPASQVEARAPPAAAAGPPLPSPEPDPRARRSPRSSEERRAVRPRVPGPAGSQGAPVTSILPGNENERAGSGFHSRPGGLCGARGRRWRGRSRGRRAPASRGGPSLPGRWPGSRAHGGHTPRGLGAAGTPDPGLGTATGHLHGTPVCLRVWTGPPMRPPAAGASPPRDEGPSWPRPLPCLPFGHPRGAPPSEGPWCPC